MSSSDLPNYDQPPRTYQNSDFQSWKLVESSKKNSVKIFGLYFLRMSPIFVGSVHNYGKSDSDIILWKMLISTRCISLCGLLNAQLEQKILDGI